MRLSETHLPHRFRTAGRMCRSAPGPTWRKSTPDLLRLGGYRSVYGLVSRFIKDERLRIVFSFHPLLIGGNPFTASAIYTLIPFLERHWGVHFAMGGTGQVVAGLANLIARPGQHHPLQRPGRSDHHWTAARHRGAARIGRDHRGRHRRVQRRLRLDLSQPAAARPAPALDRPEAGPGTVLDGPVPLVFRHRPAIPGRGAPHDPAGPALSRPAARHLPAQSAGRGLQPLSAPADGDRSHPRAAGVRCVLRAVAGAEPGRRHRLAARRPNRTVRRSPPPVGDRAAGPRPARRHVAPDDAARFPGSAVCRAWRGLRAGAGAAAKRLVPPAQPQRGHRRPVSGRRRHASRGGRAGRAVIRQGPRSRGAACRDPD